MEARDPVTLRLVMVVVAATLVSSAVGTVAGTLVAHRALWPEPPPVPPVHAPAEVAPEDLELPQDRVPAGEL